MDRIYISPQRHGEHEGKQLGKSEIRISKYETNPKSKCSNVQKRESEAYGIPGFRLQFIPHWMRGRNDGKGRFRTFFSSPFVLNFDFRSFEFVSDFGFRYSDFTPVLLLTPYFLLFFPALCPMRYALCAFFLTSKSLYFHFITNKILSLFSLRLCVRLSFSYNRSFFLFALFSLPHAPGDFPTDH